MLLLIQVHLGKLEGLADTLSGPQLCKGACELKLQFSVSSSVSSLLNSSLYLKYSAV